MEIKSIVFPDAEAWLKENLPDFSVDNVAAVYPVGNFDEEFNRDYCDEEQNDGEIKQFTFTDHVNALAKLVELVDTKKIFFYGINSGMDLVEPGNWDVEVTDAYFQLIYHGEVIYG